MISDGTSLRMGSDSRAAPSPGGTTGLDLAMLRAYSIERAVDYGCSLDDVIKLHRRVEQGANWVQIASLLAQDDIARAGRAREAGTQDTAAMFQLHAAACLRLAQAALEDEPVRRLAVYRESVAVFSAAMSLQRRDDGRFEVEYRGACHGAWLFRPDRDGVTTPPCVLIVGGADGWCEAFFGSVSAFLERGLAVCLVELPGQGLARLQDESFLDLSYAEMISATLDALVLRGVARDRFGIVGHSLGGSLAMYAAAGDDRIRACCTNGGSVDLAQGFDKYPRVLQRVGRMMGHDCAATDVLDFVEQLDLRAVVARMSTPVLCLQGGQDLLVADDEAQTLLALRPAHLTTYEYWPEGVHCLYNHGIERNCVIADWFVHWLKPVATRPHQPISRSDHA